MGLISKTEDLNAACARLARHDFITLDTEFMRETTFFSKLCLIQMASIEEDVLIDPLAPDLDLSSFFALMRNPAVLKVLHAGRQDIEIFWHADQCIPNPIFDTQIAAMVCGYGDSVSYEQLVHDFAKARIDKSSRFTDWSQRPLSDSQLHYARSDVTHLRTVYQALSAQLQANGRSHWLEDEMLILTSSSTYDLHPQDAWQRLRGRIRKPRDLGLLIELCSWREKEARERNVPRSRILKDDAIIDLVTSAPRSVEALGRLRSLPSGFERSRTAPDILSAIEKGLAHDPKSLPVLEKPERRNGNGATVELLKVLLKMVSEKEGVAAKVLATTDDLEAIAQDDEAKVPALNGWRRPVFGEFALALKHGKLALAIKDGKVLSHFIG
jgi:ribonuclease D